MMTDDHVLFIESSTSTSKTVWKWITFQECWASTQQHLCVVVGVNLGSMWLKERCSAMYCDANINIWKDGLDSWHDCAAEFKDDHNNWLYIVKWLSKESHQLLKQITSWFQSKYANQKRFECEPQILSWIMKTWIYDKIKCAFKVIILSHTWFWCKR